MKKSFILLIAALTTAAAYPQNLSIKVEGRKYGYVNESGSVVIPLVYNWAQPFSEGLACVRVDSQFHFIYANGKIAFKMPGVNYTRDFHEGLCAIFKDQKFGYINKEGKIVIPCTYSYANDFSEGLAAVTVGERRGMIDRNGKLVIPAIYDEIGYCREGMINVRKDGKCGHIDRKGRIVVPLQYRYTDVFVRGMARIQGEGLWGFINKKGDTIAPFIFDYLDTLVNGYALVGKNGKFGYILPSGKLFIPMAWDRAHRFDGEKKLAIVWKGQERFRIFYRGDTLAMFPDEIGVPGSTTPDLQTQHRIINFPGEPMDFFDGYAMVVKDGKVGYKNRKDEIVIPCQYPYAFNFANSVAIVHNGRKWGLIDKKGNNITPFQFDDIGVFEAGYVKVHVDGQAYFINYKGEKLQ